MRISIASAGLAAAFVLAPVAVGTAPASAQDFSITNQQPADGSLRDVMRQLQAWWDVHAYYPRHAAAGDESGTVKVHLVILSDGRIRSAEVVGGSGSASIDGAGAAAFRKGFVRPLPDGARGFQIDLSLHYVLAHRHDQPSPPNITQVASKSNFTVTNDPVKSVILETMLQKTCTGTIVDAAVRNHPIYGIRYYGSQAIFFRTADGNPWVKFTQGTATSVAPVHQIGQMLEWTGPMMRDNHGQSSAIEYTVWPEGDNRFIGNINKNFYSEVDFEAPGANTNGTIDFTCTTETVPAPKPTWWAIAPGPSAPDDPP